MSASSTSSSSRQQRQKRRVPFTNSSTGTTPHFHPCNKSLPRTFLWLLLIYLVSAISFVLVRYNDVTFWDNTVDSVAKEPTIVFIHPGKTGGTTIGSMLKVFCDSRTKLDSREYCLQEWKQKHNGTDNESLISQYTRGFLHVTGYYPSFQAIQQQQQTHSHFYYLMSLRHPVERVVSWFYFLHPINCYSVNGVPTPRQNYTLIDKACITKRRMNSTRMSRRKVIKSREAQFYQDCFPTIHQFALAFGTDYNYLDSSANDNNDCHVLALETLQGYGGPNAMAGHLWANYTYYQQQLWKLLVNSKKSVALLAIRTEHLWQDLATTEQYLGGTGQVFRQQQQLELQQKQQDNNNNAAASSHYHKDKLSPLEYTALCCALYEEFEVYQDLLQTATNLPESEIKETLKQGYQKCHVTLYSLADLHLYCQQEKHLYSSNFF